MFPPGHFMMASSTRHHSLITKMSWTRDVVVEYSRSNYGVLALLPQKSTHANNMNVRDVVMNNFSKFIVNSLATS